MIPSFWRFLSVQRGEVEVDLLTEKELMALPNYSCTLPTGTVVGKKWRRDMNEPKRFHGHDKTLPELWWTGEFIPDDRPGMIGIRWRRVVILGAT